MDDIIEFYGNEMLQMVKNCEKIDHAILGIAAELFSDKVTVVRIAFLMAFAKKIIEQYPEKKSQVFEDIFHGIYFNMKF